VGEGEQEVDDGGREQSTAPAAGRQKAEQRGRGAGRKKGEGMKPGTVLQNQRKTGTSL
jgi:hypothetical protein